MFKTYNKIVNFSTEFCLRSISNEFGATESQEVSLKGNMQYFSVNHNAIVKSDIWNIYKYLMVKNNIT